MQIFTAENWKETRTGQNECRNNVEPLFLAGVTTVRRAGIRPAPILSRHDLVLSQQVATLTYGKYWQCVTQLSGYSSELCSKGWSGPAIHRIPYISRHKKNVRNRNTSRRTL